MVKVLSCFQVYYEWEQKPYLNMISNSVLKSLYEKNSSALGVKFCTDPLLVNAPVGSTDMGNVSHVLPSLHPHYEIHDKFVPHSPPFTEVAGNNLTYILMLSLYFCHTSTKTYVSL